MQLFRNVVYNGVIVDYSIVLEDKIKHFLNEGYKIKIIQKYTNPITFLNTYTLINVDWLFNNLWYMDILKEDNNKKHYIVNSNFNTYYIKVYK